MTPPSAPPPAPAPPPPPAPAPRLTIIVARARNGVIGRDNALPWHLPEDLRQFKRTTTGHAVLMGRRTHESIGRPLPGRRNLVVSRTPGYASPGVEVFTSLPDALRACAADPEVFVIGGAQLYDAVLPLADRAIVTEIDLDADGDARFPALDAAPWRPHWRQASREEAVSSGGLRYAIVQYARQR